MRLYVFKFIDMVKKKKKEHLGVVSGLTLLHFLCDYVFFYKVRCLWPWIFFNALINAVSSHEQSIISEKEAFYFSFSRDI